MLSYIGICDFPSGEQAKKTANFFQSLISVSPKTMNMKLMVGLMMSYKTMKDLPSKWTDVWLKKEEVAEVFIDHPSVFNTLHYADYESKTMSYDLVEAVGYCGKNLHAIQLDMIWPSQITIRKFSFEKSNIKIVLQINAKALALAKDDPMEVVRRLKEYDGMVDYALLDKSHGKGIGMDANVLLPFACAISEHLPQMGLVAAGGLGPKTMYLIEPLVREFPNVSMDMQGQMRASGNALDPIDWDIAHESLPLAVDLYK